MPLQRSPCPASHPRALARPDFPTTSPRQSLGDSPSVPIAREQRHDLSHRIPNRPSLFTKNRLITKPSRLTLGIAAATVAFVAGIAIGTAARPTTAAGNPAALNRAGVSKATSDPASPHSNAIPTPAGKAATARHEGPARHPLARHHHAHAVQRRATHAAPYLIYDSVIPSAIPAHHVAAVYATGPHAASPSQLAGKGPVVWIDTIGSDPAASALDVEPGDATPSVAASWAYQRLSQRPHAIARIYTMILEWPAVKAAIAGLPHKMQSRVRYWIADPNGVPHIVPGSDATQWYWGTSYDISTATPRF